MSNLFQITCVKCGHEFHVDLDELDVKDQWIAKGEKKKTYREECPRCHTSNVFAVKTRKEGTGR